MASDLGVGLSTLNKWVTAHRDTEVVSDKDLDLARENERLRRENRILKEEREILERVWLNWFHIQRWDFPADFLSDYVDLKPFSGGR